MTTKIADGTLSIMASLAAFAMIGCAHQADTAHVENMLSASGFQMKIADTPDKLAHVQSFPQQKVVPVQREGQLKFVWADAQGCKCLYVGTEANYQAYAKLAEQERISHEYYEAAQSAAAWGWQPGWGPEWWWW